MATLFTPDILEMLFTELGLDFESWANSSGYDANTWTDQQIYAALPDEVLQALGDFGLNASWFHGGM